MAVPHCLMWCIWREKNYRCFEDYERTVVDLKLFFFRTLSDWMSIIGSYSIYLIYDLMNVIVNGYKAQGKTVISLSLEDYYMHVACFLSSLPMTLDLVKSQLLASKDLPSLSEVFGRLRHSTLFYCSTATLPSCDKSAFVTSMGSGRGGHVGQGVGVKAVEVVSKRRRL